MIALDAQAFDDAMAFDVLTLDAPPGGMSRCEFRSWRKARGYASSRGIVADLRTSLAALSMWTRRADGSATTAGASA